MRGFLELLSASGDWHVGRCNRSTSPEPGDLLRCNQNSEQLLEEMRIIPITTSISSCPSFRLLIRALKRFHDNDDVPAGIQ